MLNKIALISFSALLLLSSCKREEVAQRGYLDLRLSSEGSAELLVRSGSGESGGEPSGTVSSVSKPSGEPSVRAEDGPAILSEQVFSVSVVSDAGLSYPVISDWGANHEPLALPAGQYTVTVSQGTNQAAAWNAPFYSGQAQALVKPEQTNVLNVVCSLANTLVTTEFSGDIRDGFSEYRLTVDNGLGDALVFGKEAGTLADSAYFSVTGKLYWELYMVNNDGVVYRTERAEIDGVKAKQHYHLKFSIDRGSVPDGGGYFKIVLDDTYKVSYWPLIVDLNKENTPVISSNLDFSNPVVGVQGTAADLALGFSAPAGIKNVVISHADPALTALGLPVRADLVEIAPETLNSLSALGINAASVAFGSFEAEADLSGLFPKLPIGSYTLTVSLIDVKNSYSQKTLKLNVLSSVEVEALSSKSWGAFAILEGKWFTDAVPEGLAFEYRLKSSSQWLPVSSSSVLDEARKTVSVELYGLVPDTEYVFRLVSAKDKTTREITFRTAIAPTVPNLSFDAWYLDGKVWYPASGASERYWDTANPGTAILNVNPTTAETADLASVGSGKAAAKLVSSLVMGQFAAGNIYTGSFVKVAGFGAELDWGFPFTGKPLALKGFFKYSPKPIDKAKAPYEAKMGDTDSFHITVFLSDMAAPFRVNTSTGTFLRPDDPSVIAYGELVSSESSPAYTEFTIPLKYYSLDRTPSYIVITGAASHLGDYFTGGVGSQLLLDEFSLVYDAGVLSAAERAEVNYK